MVTGNKKTDGGQCLQLYTSTHSATRSPAFGKNRIEHLLVLLNSNHHPHGGIKKTFQIFIIVFMGHCTEEPKLEVFFREVREDAGRQLGLIPSIGDSLFKKNVFFLNGKRFI